jgi:hypothetical protein
MAENFEEFLSAVLMRLLDRHGSETGSSNRHLQAESNFDYVDGKDAVHRQGSGTKRTLIQINKSRCNKITQLQK